MDRRGDRCDRAACLDRRRTAIALGEYAAYFDLRGLPSHTSASLAPWLAYPILDLFPSRRSAGLYSFAGV